MDMTEQEKLEQYNAERMEYEYAEDQRHEYEAAQALSVPPCYRLIDGSDTIRADDEFLEDDAETWTPIGEDHRWLVGHRWHTAYVPVRRKQQQKGK